MSKQNRNKNYKDIYCHNCGAPLNGNENFCPQCGKKNDNRPLNIFNYITKVFDNIFSLDNKILYTIFSLIKNTSKVIQEYIDGKTLKYANPFRLVFNLGLIFYILNSFNFFDHNQEKNKTIKEATPKDLASVEKIFPKVSEKTIDSIIYKRSIDSILLSNKIGKKKKEEYIVDLLKTRTKISPYSSSKNPIIEKEIDSSFPTQSFSLLNVYLLEQDLKRNHINYQSPLLDSIKQQATGFNFDFFSFIANRPEYKYLPASNVLDSLKMPHSVKNIWTLNALQKISKMIDNQGDRDQYQKVIMSKITLSLFFILPLFTLLLNLFYFKTAYGFTEKLIFVFYLQSVFIIGFILLTILSWFFKTYYLNLLFFLLFFIYLYVNFKSFFNQKSSITFLKLLLLIIPSYLTLASLALLILSILALIF